MDSTKGKQILLNLNWIRVALSELLCEINSNCLNELDELGGHGAAPLE
jgi:hypothetical protein